MNSPLSNLPSIQEWHNVSLEIFNNEILKQSRPAILRGVVSDWPVVSQARHSAASASAYVAGFDNGKLVDAIMTPPEVDGRIFYNDDMSGFNFLRNQVTVTSVLSQLARYANFASAPSVAVQSALMTECLPGFGEENQMRLLSPDIFPRIWIGNNITTPAHFDQSHNIACVTSGVRRFTVFPPEQVGNLYIGPLDFSPTPTPISMVDFNQPDLARFPKFSDALANAQVADLNPGDAIYIPPMWWHHVQSRGALNMLVNYWWDAPKAGTTPALDCLLDCFEIMKKLDPDQRVAWRAMFQHYLLNSPDDVAAHIPMHKRGVLGTVDMSGL